MHRDLFVIGLVAVAALGIGTFIFFYGPNSLASQVGLALGSGSSAATPATVPSTVLAQGTNAVSITSRANYRIQNAHDLEALWALIYGEVDTPATPNIDFTKYEILAVFDGPDPSSGYSVTISSVTDEDDRRLVLVTHNAPNSACPAKGSATNPFEVVEVSATSLSMSHQDQQGTVGCP